jgi:hypothetical protein
LTSLLPLEAGQRGGRGGGGQAIPPQDGHVKLPTHFLQLEHQFQDSSLFMCTAVTLP